ncbi:hypothetical protein LOTGIDRAFT_160261 [Lottia gigantea]|uniref:Uncharacterized protein n=1 Tax=Lottia gigantea TaxID=225164 RepID=V4C2H5_LOTGI|nr:hypothetical protein LOTGIDRAFT_160261 [Lottia gigantea]ESO95709.1 hypothetical protein LOTGIDRAFT_160261 [Lottia gigantea]
MVHRNTGKNQTVLSLVAELGSESNAHGLARVVTSRETKRKVIWALLVIIGFTAATLQLSLLVRKYLQFQVVEVSEIKDSMPVEFPSVTVCNIEPISLRKLRLMINNSESDLVQWLTFVNHFNFGPQQAHLTSIRAFYENLGDAAENLSHDINDFMIHCRFNQELCSVANFTSFFDGNYYSCYTFNSGSVEKLLMHATGPQNGLSLILSLDNDDPPYGTYGMYHINSNILHSAGVRVVIHAPNTMPSPVDHGFDVPPGYSSSIGLNAVMHTRLSEPFGNCTNKELDGYKSYKNTFFSCLQLCQQRIIIKNCGCKSSSLPEVLDPNITFCGVVPNWQEILNRSTEYKNKTIAVPNLACEEKYVVEMANDRSYEFSCKCYQPCDETTYQKAVSLSYWPLEFYQLHALQVFFDTTIKQNFMHEAYTYLARLGNLDHSMDPNDTRRNEILQQSYNLSDKDQAERASNLIRQNLLRLNVYLEGLSVVEFRQMAAYGLADLFADIGGTLGLWMGISVLTIMELIELIVRLFLLLFNSEKKIPEQDPVSNGMLETERDYEYERTGVESPV